MFSALIIARSDGSGVPINLNATFVASELGVGVGVLVGWRLGVLVSVGLVVLVGEGLESMSPGMGV